MCRLIPTTFLICFSLGFCIWCTSPQNCEPRLRASTTSFLETKGHPDLIVSEETLLLLRRAGDERERERSEWEHVHKRARERTTCESSLGRLRVARGRAAASVALIASARRKRVGSGGVSGLAGWFVLQSREEREVDGTGCCWSGDDLLFGRG